MQNLQLPYIAFPVMTNWLLNSRFNLLIIHAVPSVPLQAVVAERLNVNIGSKTSSKTARSQCQQKHEVFWMPGNLE